MREGKTFRSGSAGNGDAVPFLMSAAAKCARAGPARSTTVNAMRSILLTAAATAGEDDLGGVVYVGREGSGLEGLLLK